jgi:hypothetical protein
MTTDKTSPIFAKTTLERAAEKMGASTLTAKTYPPFASTARIQRVMEQTGGALLKDLPITTPSAVRVDRAMGVASATFLRNTKAPSTSTALIQRVMEQAGGTLLKDLPNTNASTALIQRVLERASGTLLKDLPLIQAEEVEEIASKLREAEDEESVAAISAAYSQIVDANTAEPNRANDLALTIPFHDRYARATLQLVAVAAYMAVAYIVGLASAACPPLSAALWASGYTPNAKIAWKATGKAYDRIFSKENNHFPREAPTTKKDLW